MFHGKCAASIALHVAVIGFQANTLHLGERRGANRIYVTLHNKGPFAVTNARKAAEREI